MAVTAVPFGHFPVNLLGGLTGAEVRKVDWLTDVIKLMLTTSAYVPNKDTHKFKSDVTNEITGTGYTAGGATLATKTLTYNATTDIVTLDAADVTFTAATLTARIAVIYDDREVAAADKELIGYVDFGVDQSVAGVDFVLSFDVNGILRFTVIG